MKVAAGRSGCDVTTNTIGSWDGLRQPNSTTAPLRFGRSRSNKPSACRPARSFA